MSCLRPSDAPSIDRRSRDEAARLREKRIPQLFAEITWVLQFEFEAILPSFSVEHRGGIP
jgi:hypothetical protein